LTLFFEDKNKKIVVLIPLDNGVTANAPPISEWRLEKQQPIN